MSLSQSLQQKLLQKLSPQQIQLMKLLQVPTANLEERIKEELEENPALEMDEEGHTDEFGDDMKDEFENSPEDEFDPDGSSDEYDNVDISEYVQEDDDEIAEYRLKDDNYPEMEEGRSSPHSVETSFHEQLLEQLQGNTYEGVERTIDVHIRNLRRKVERDPAHPRYVETVFGAGYRCTAVGVVNMFAHTAHVESMAVFDRAAELA